MLLFHAAFYQLVSCLETWVRVQRKAIQAVSKHNRFSIEVLHVRNMYKLLKWTQKMFKIQVKGILSTKPSPRREGMTEAKVEGMIETTCEGFCR